MLRETGHKTREKLRKIAPESLRRMGSAALRNLNFMGGKKQEEAPAPTANVDTFNVPKMKDVPAAFPNDHEVPEGVSPDLARTPYEERMNQTRMHDPDHLFTHNRLVTKGSEAIEASHKASEDKNRETTLAQAHTEQLPRIEADKKDKELIDA